MRIGVIGVRKKMTDKIDVLNLENGLSCCFRQCDYYQNFVTMALVVKVGSMCETIKQRGVAHLLEHLLMSFWTFDLYKDIKYRTKAYTDFNETIFYIKCPVSEQNLKGCIQILQYIAQGKFLNKKFFTRAQEDVLREIREEKGKQSITNILLKESEYDDFYALGDEDAVLQMGYGDVMSFFERYYSASIMSLVIMGDIVHMQELKEYIRKLFLNVQSFPMQMTRKKVFIPDYKNRIQYIQSTKDDINNSEINLIFKINKDTFITKEEIVRNEIIENIAFEIIISEFKTFLNRMKLEINIEFERKELSVFYMFYSVKIKTEPFSSNYVERMVCDIKTYIDMQLNKKEYNDKKIAQLINEYSEIEYDSDLYYRVMGMHQMLLECIDMYTLEKPVITYEEKCLLYTQVSKKIKTRDIYNFIKLLLGGDRIFIINL